MAETPESHPEGSGRKSREYGKGASSGAARREPVRPEGSQLMEAVVARENLLDAYARVMSNIEKKWTMPIREWKRALQQFAIMFEGRMPLP